MVVAHRGPSRDQAYLVDLRLFIGEGGGQRLGPAMQMRSDCVRTHAHTWVRARRQHPSHPREESCRRRGLPNPTARCGCRVPAGGLSGPSLAFSFLTSFSSRNCSSSAMRSCRLSLANFEFTASRARFVYPRFVGRVREAPGGAFAGGQGTELILNNTEFLRLSLGSVQVRHCPDGVWQARLRGSVLCSARTLVGGGSFSLRAKCLPSQRLVVASPPGDSP